MLIISSMCSYQLSFYYSVAKATAVSDVPVLMTYALSLTASLWADPAGSIDDIAGVWTD